MYIRMNVGAYQGEIRGPFNVETARALIARGDASPTESIGDGKFRVIETAPCEVEETAPCEVEETAQPVAASARQSQSIPPRRRR